MSDIVFQLTTKTSGIKRDYYFVPGYTRWIVKAPDNKGSLIFNLSTDSDDDSMPKSYQVLESPREIARLLNKHGVKTIEVNNVYFTRSGANLAVAAPYTMDHTVGALNTKQQGMLHQFLAECKAADQKVVEESVTLYLGGETNSVTEFQKHALLLAKPFGSAKTDMTRFGHAARGVASQVTITVHCPPTETEGSLQRQKDFVAHVRRDFPVASSIMGVGYGSGQ